MIIYSEDVSRHITVFDGIRHTGGYLFQDWHEATTHAYTGMITYPQGSHLVSALLDGFLRSSATDYGSGLNAADHYLGFMVAGHAFLVLTMIWAAQWLVGASLTLGRRIVIIAFVTAFCGADMPMSLVFSGYSSETAGLAEMVLLVAVLSRPTRRTGQQLLLATSLLVAVGFTYYLFLPAAGLAWLGWLIHRRAIVRRRPVLAATAIGLGGLLALFPLVLGLTVGDQGSALLLAAPLRPSRDVIIALAALVGAGLLGQRARRSRIWRSYTWCLVSAGATTGALLVVQRLMGDGNGYYANKTLHLTITVLVVGLGSLLLYLPTPTRGRVTLRQWVAAAPAALVAIGAAFGLIRGDSPYHPTDSTNFAQVWYDGKYRNNAAARDIMRLYQPGREPVPTLVVSDDPYQSYVRTLYLSTLERTAGAVARGLYIRERSMSRSDWSTPSRRWTVRSGSWP